MGAYPSAVAQNQGRQPDPYETVGNALKLKQALVMAPLQQQEAQQQVQGGALDLQVKQQQLKDQQAMTEAYKRWDGKDPGDLAKLVTANGGSANARTGIEQHYLGIRKTYSDIAKTDAETGSKNLDIIKQKNDNALGAINAAESVPDEQLGQHLAETVQQLQQSGMLDQQHAQAGAALAQAIQSGQIDPKTA